MRFKLSRATLVLLVLAAGLCVLPPSTTDKLRMTLSVPLAGAARNPQAWSRPEDRRERELDRRHVDAIVALEAEVRDMRRALASISDFRGFRPRIAREAILPVRVLLRQDLSSQTATLVVDRGASDGVAPGMLLMVGGSLAGVVDQTLAEQSLVRHVSDPMFRIRAVVERSRVEAVLQGSLDGQARLRHMDRKADVRPGDRVVSAGGNSRYPEGIPVGEVRSVGGEPWALERDVAVRPYVLLDELEGAFLVKLGKDSGSWEQR